MAVLEEFVETRIDSTIRDYYAGKGYDVEGVRRLKVRPTDLKRTSEIMVTPICDECGDIGKPRKYKFVSRDSFYGKYLCFTCRYDINVIVDHSQRESRGEYEVRKWLESAGVNFRMQVRRKGVIGCSGKPLLFDFAILDRNDNPTAFIEYDGEQHYKPVVFEGDDPEKAQDKFVFQQECDRRKDRHCEALGVPMIRITYETPISDVGSELEKRLEGVLDYA